MTTQTEVLGLLRERIRRGELTPDEANVEKVRMLRVEVVIGRVPANIRSALGEAVKRGYLRYMKKEGHRPEVYFHPDFDHLANGERARVAAQVEAGLRAYACAGRRA